jgi:hypothetical protein
VVVGAAAQAVPIGVAGVAVEGAGGTRRRSRDREHEAGKAAGAGRIGSAVAAVAEAGSGQGDSRFVVACLRHASCAGVVEFPVILGGTAGEAFSVAVASEAIVGACLAAAIVEVVVLSLGAHAGSVVVGGVGAEARNAGDADIDGGTGHTVGDIASSTVLIRVVLTSRAHREASCRHCCPVNVVVRDIAYLTPLEGKLEGRSIGVRQVTVEV